MNLYVRFQCDPLFVTQTHRHIHTHAHAHTHTHTHTHTHRRHTSQYDVKNAVLVYTEYRNNNQMDINLWKK